MASKRHDKVTRTGWRYELLITDHQGRKYPETVTISRRNDKAVVDGILKSSRVRRVQVRSLSKCIFAMAPGDYYTNADIITMESVLID